MEIATAYKTGPPDVRRASLAMTNVDSASPTNGLQGQASTVRQRRIKMTLLRSRTSLMAAKNLPCEGQMFRPDKSGLNMTTPQICCDRPLHRKDAVDALGYVGQVGLIAAA